jgi:hypothetical protein
MSDVHVVFKLFTFRTFGTRKKYAVRRSRMGETNNNESFSENGGVDRASVMPKLAIVCWSDPRPQPETNAVKASTSLI